MTTRSTRILTGALLACLAASVARAQRPRATAKAPPAATLARIDSTRDEFANTITVKAVNSPDLFLNSLTILYPKWDCEPNQPCALSSLHLVVDVGIPKGRAVDDDVAKEAWDDAVKAFYLDWDFVIETPNDTLRFSWAIDSLAYSTFMRTERRALGSGDITAAGVLDAIPVATRLLIRQRLRRGGDPATPPRIIVGTSEWLDRVQRSHRRLTDGRRQKIDGPT